MLEMLKKILNLYSDDEETFEDEEKLINDGERLYNFNDLLIDEVRDVAQYLDLLEGRTNDEKELAERQRSPFYKQADFWKVSLECIITEIKLRDTDLKKCEAKKFKALFDIHAITQDIKHLINALSRLENNVYRLRRERLEQERELLAQEEGLNEILLFSPEPIEPELTEAEDNIINDEMPDEKEADIFQMQIND